MGLWAHEPVKECSFLPTEGNDIWEAGFQRDQACHQFATSAEPDIGQKTKGGMFMYLLKPGARLGDEPAQELKTRGQEGNQEGCVCV